MKPDATPLEFLAIGGEQFSLLINPIIPNYQILHQRTGLHVVSFDLPEFAVSCFLQLEAQVPAFLDAPNGKIRAQIKHINNFYQQKEEILKTTPTLKVFDLISPTLLAQCHTDS